MLKKFETLWTYGLFAAMVLFIIFGVSNCDFIGYLLVIALCCTIPYTLWLIWDFAKCIFGLIFSGELGGFIKGVLLAATLIFPAGALMLFHLYYIVVCFVIFFVFIIYLFIG